MRGPGFQVASTITATKNQQKKVLENLTRFLTDT